jgi:hypothetical protein
MYAGLTLVTPPAGEPVSIATLKNHARVTVAVDDGMLGGYITAARQYAESYTNRAFLTQTWRLALRAFPGRDYVSTSREWTSLEQYYRWNYIAIPRPPLIAVSSFIYTDTSGTVFNMAQGFSSTMGNYLPPDLNFEPARLYLPFSGVWPTTILVPGSAIQITYTAGYPSFSGVVNVDTTGKILSFVSGSNFDPTMAGGFIDVAGQSGTVQAVASGTSLTLQNAITPSQAAVAYAANAVPHSIKQAILIHAAHLYQNRESHLVDSDFAETPLAVRSLLDQYRNFHAIQEND